MYFKDDLVSKDMSELKGIAEEFDIDFNPKGDKEELVYEILERQAMAEASKNPLGGKRKRTRITKKEAATDHVYSVNGKEGENLDSKKNKVATTDRPKSDALAVLFIHFCLYDLKDFLKNSFFISCECLI